MPMHRLAGETASKTFLASLTKSIHHLATVKFFLGSAPLNSISSLVITLS